MRAYVPAVCHQTPAANARAVVVRIVEVREAQEMARLVGNHANAADRSAASAPDTRGDVVRLDLNAGLGGPCGAKRPLVRPDAVEVVHAIRIVAAPLSAVAAVCL